MSHVLKDDTVMSKGHAPEDQEIETGRTLKEDSHYGPHLSSTTFETSGPDTPGLPCSSQSTPSPSEGSGLLSLPWEMVTQIASHLPAQCVISVLPKVCQALGNIGEDSTSWQLRAGRLTGSRVKFPVGSREGYDWPNACLEMEDLITCWEDQAAWVDRHTKARDDGTQAVQGAEVRGKEERRGEADQDAEGFVLAERAEELGVDAVMEVAFEGKLEMQAHGQRANSKERRRRPEEAAAVAMVKEERCNERGPPEAPEGCGNGGANPQLGGGGAELGVEEPEPLRPLSPTPALERVPLPSTGHYAQVNSVLLIGGEGAVCVSGSRDTNVILWDLHGGRDATPHMLRGQGLASSHRGWVWCLASRGSLLASGSFDSTIRLWDLGAGGAERGRISTSAPVLCLSCQPDVLLAGTFNKTISLYDTRLAEPLVKSLQLHGKAVMCLAADEQYIISGSQDYTVAIFDRRAGKTLKRLRLRSYLLSMCYQNGEVWAGDNKGIIHAFSVRSGVLKPLSQFDVGHTSLVTGIHKSPGSLYTSSSDRTLKVHIPCAPPRTLCTLNYQEGVSGLSVESGVLAVASGETSVEVWRPCR
ncbi:F-box/WD repeat-containing protein 9 [Gadus morhua]|uniref:F-box/WD repeat-containing protein 9 n=1 Tax=Gadus morhua TaxID=8049 RepID=A0A8C5AAR1_GADMO|nr:F-box/WD repeat-containing protein 9 [Gadus morhua]